MSFAAALKRAAALKGDKEAREVPRLSKSADLADGKKRIAESLRADASNPRRSRRADGGSLKRKGATPSVEGPRSEPSNKRPVDIASENVVLPASSKASEKGGETSTGGVHGDERKASKPESSVPEKRPARDKKAGEPLADTESPLLPSIGTHNPTPRITIPKENPEQRVQEPKGESRRGADKKDAKVTVLDMRMKAESRGSTAGATESGGKDAASNTQEGFPIGDRQPGGILHADTPAEAPAAKGTSFADILSRHLTDAGSQEIVKAAQIVLRDGDSGIIRLRLEPESLGSVKIELKLTEKNITGRIVVESDEAKNAFERNLAGLRDAFSSGGFETANLEVSVGGGEMEGRGEAGGENAPSPFFSERLRELETSVPTLSLGGVPARGERGVNILV